MASQLGDLKKFIGDIKERINSLCSETCRDLNLDEKKVFDEKIEHKQEKKTDDVSDENIDESSMKPKAAAEKSDKMHSVKNGKMPSISVKYKTSANDNGEDGDALKNDFDDGNSEFDVDGDISDDDNANSENGEKVKNVNNTVDPKLGIHVGFSGNDGENGNGNGGGVGGGLKKFGTKRVAKYALKKGYKSLAKRAAAKTAAKGASKIGGKVAAKTAGKIGAKSIAKKLPFGLGLLPAAWFAGERALGGDYSGAGLELASGAASIVPYLGTAGSFGIDAYLADRDVRRDTGKGLIGHGMNKAGKLASNYVGNRIRKSMSESFEIYNTLYDRAKSIFDSESGVNESVDGYCFDDYVTESKIDNLAVSESSVDESNTFFGYGLVCENFGNDAEELKKLFEQISSDGKITADDFEIKDTDSPDVKRAKNEILRIIKKRKAGKDGLPDLNFNAKEYKKALDMSMDSSGQPTNLQLFHKGLDQLGNGVARGLERNFLIPQELSKKLSLPKNMARLAGAGAGGLLFGPVGAVAGTALANWIANRHEKYKANQYAKLHGIDEKKVSGKRDGYIGSLVGTGIGSLFGGPVGGVIGAGIGHLLDRKKGSEVKS